MKYLQLFAIFALSACGSPINESATQTSAAVAALINDNQTQTANAPTSTPVPTSTPTSTPTLVPTATVEKLNFKPAIEIGSELLNKDPAALAAWLGYGATRSKWLTDNLTKELLRDGEYQTLYEDELAGRLSLVKLWTSMAGLDANIYLDELRQVHEAGYLNEYVWVMFWVDFWGEPDDSLRLDEFEDWMTVNLPNHVAETLVSIAVDIEE